MVQNKKILRMLEMLRTLKNGLHCFFQLRTVRVRMSLDVVVLL